MSEAKLRFSGDQIGLVKNAAWILTKNEVIGKVCDFFGSLSVQMKTDWMRVPYLSSIPAEIRAKISRGEQYQGLPYVVLDYPREFGKENSFAIRTLFWWGNYFSINLHLTGMYKEMFFENIIHHFEMLAGKGFYVCISDDEWAHAINETDYKKLDQSNQELFRDYLSRKSFCKLSVKISLDDWEQAGELLLAHFQTIRQSLED